VHNRHIVEEDLVKAEPTESRPGGKMLWRWDRFAPASGLLFVGLLLVDSVLEGEARGTDPSIHTYFSENRTAALASVYVTLASAIVFIPFLLAVWGRLSRGGDEVSVLPAASFVLGLAGLCFVLLRFAIAAPLAAQIAGHADATLTWALYQVSFAIFWVGQLFLGLFSFTASLVVMRTTVLPRWLGRLGLGAGTGYIVGTFAIADVTQPVAIPGIVGVLLFVIWIALMSIFMIRQPASSHARQSVRVASAVLD